MQQATSSFNWRTQIKQRQLVSQISSILLQRLNWVPLLRNLNLSNKLTPPFFLEILQKTQTHPQISLSFFNWVQSNLNFQPDLRCKCHVIQACLGSGLVEPVKPILDSLVQAQPAAVLAEAMNQACKGKDSKSKALTFVLESYSQKGLFIEGLEAFRKMRVSECNASVHACNMLIDVLGRENETRLAWCFIGAMIRDGVLPDKSTWSLVAKILCKDGNFERIVKLLDSGIYNSVMYNIVVDCYGKSGDFDSAFERLSEMCDRKLNPGFLAYSSILDGACKLGNVEVIERVMSEMVEKGLLPKCHLSQCDSTIQKLCDLGKTNAVMMFYKGACDGKIGLEDATYRCMLKALSKEGRAAEAVGLYRVILERGIAMKDDTYHVFVDLVCKEDGSGEGYELLKDIMGRGFKPRMSVLSKFMSSQCSKHRWREMEELLNLVLEKGLLPEPSSCSSLAKHYCSRGQIDKAVQLHHKMEELHASLDIAAYNTLVDILAKRGRMEEAGEVFDYMKGLKLVDSLSFTAMIRGLCRAKELRKAMKLHDEMLKMELKPDKATYKSLILEFKP